ncbi:MAG: M28 family peptidase [Algoriphagus sp.]|uniref:M28 family peptidase n=1 Tax=Algoriphagus sp. TaxID=1872435 RepID=UPI00184C3E14|nr:M28 family peptidase [Algoriphagus sp.]NVJ86631.1 M28 family peptidase [Algoriphagus sp.]
MRWNLQVFATIILFFTAHSSFSQKLQDRNLIKNLVFLSSDELKGRESGTPENLRARDYIKEQFIGMGLETQYPDFFQEFRFTSRRENTTITGFNVVGFVPGTESKKIIVITAHFDHVGIGRPTAAGDSIYNGADDNASGTAALIEMARYFSQNPPKHSMIFAALDAEEKGLQGAKALVEDFPFELDQILLNINMDMISRNEAGELYVSGTHYYPEYRALLEEVSEGKKPTLKFGHDTPGTGREDWTRSSDHGAFFDKKIPHLYFGVEDHEDYHQPSDEYSQVNPRFFVDASHLILACIEKIDQDFIIP